MIHRASANGCVSARVPHSPESVLALDFTLAWRMLVRYPGLSIVGVFGMAVGIAIAAGAFTDRLRGHGSRRCRCPKAIASVSLVNWDASTNNRELRLMHDFAAWRA